jgi:hypothetical protein
MQHAPQRELSGHVRNTTRFCMGVGDIVSAPTTIGLQCLAKEAEWSSHIELVTKPIIGLLPGQSGVVVAWDRSPGKPVAPAIKWVHAVRETPSNHCLEVGWQARDKGIIDRLCFGTQVAYDSRLECPARVFPIATEN